MKEGTKELKLPTGVKVVIKEYAEAAVILDMPKHSDTTKFLVESLVISIGDETEGIYDRVRALRIRDYKALDNALADLIEDKDPKK